MVTKDPDYTFDDAVHQALAHVGAAFQYSVGLDGALPKSLAPAPPRSLDDILESIEKKLAVGKMAEELLGKIRSAQKAASNNPDRMTELTLLAAELEGGMLDEKTVQSLADRVATLTAQVATESGQAMERATAEQEIQQIWGQIREIDDKLDVEYRKMAEKGYISWTTYEEWKKAHDKLKTLKPGDEGFEEANAAVEAANAKVQKEVQEKAPDSEPGKQKTKEWTEDRKKKEDEMEKEKKRKPQYEIKQPSSNWSGEDRSPENLGNIPAPSGGQPSDKQSALVPL